MNQPRGLQTQDAAAHELYRLLSAWADGVLTDAEFSRLDDVLKGREESRRAFARYVRMCQSLPELVVPSLDDASPHNTVGATTVAAGHPARIRLGLAGMRRLLRQPWIVVATLLVAVVAGAWGVFLRDNVGGGQPVVTAKEPVAHDAATTAAVTPSDSGELDTHFAVVTRTDNVVWEAGGVPAEIGGALGSQVLRLAAGTLEFEFACGASLRLRGPAEFALISKSRGKLLFGELSAQVPEQAHGFTIDTPSVEVVDLGTEFGVNVDHAGISDVHVFRGLVETRMPSSDEQPGSLERLSTDQTRRFAPDEPKSSLLSFDETQFPLPPERYRDEPTTQGAICLLREPPKSLAVGALESNEFILLFEERKDVAVQRAIPVNLSLPGRYDRFKGKDGKLRPPLHVDSYLLHFDALTTPRNYNHLRLDGSVTFPRPIRGVIAVGPALTLTDPLFGISDVVQSDARSRGLDRGLKGNNPDIVTLSADRRTLHVSFSVGGSCDQLRILIEAEQKPNVQNPSVQKSNVEN